MAETSANTKPARKRRPWIIILIIVVVGLLAIGIGLRARPGSDLSSSYLSQIVTKGTVTASVSASGQLVDAYTYSVAPNATPVLTQRDGVAVGTTATAGSATGSSGTSTGAVGGATAAGYVTTAISANVGDHVAANGQIATAANATVKNTDLATAQSNARAAVNNAQVALSNDQSSLASQQALAVTPATTQSINTLQKQVSADSVAINSARATLTTAEENTANASVSVTSPVDGYIRSLTTAVGATASQIATIGSGGVDVSVMVSEYDIARVLPNQTVQLSLGSSPAPFTGTVSSISQVPNSSTGVQDYQVVIATSGIPATGRIGMTVSASIGIASHAAVLNVPPSAITTRNGGSVVTVINASGNTTVKKVTLGLVGDSSVEITSGLIAGERVVTGASGSVPVVTSVTTPAGTRTS